MTEAILPHKAFQALQLSVSVVIPSRAASRSRTRGIAIDAHLRCRVPRACVRLAGSSTSQQSAYGHLIRGVLHRDVNGHGV